MNQNSIVITKEEWEIIKVWAGGMGFLANLSSAIKKQGYITKKQRYWLHKTHQDVTNPKPKSSRYYRYYENPDWTEADYEIGAYELCVGEWGD